MIVFQGRITRYGARPKGETFSSVANFLANQSDRSLERKPFHRVFLRPVPGTGSFREITRLVFSALVGLPMTSESTFL